MEKEFATETEEEDVFPFETRTMIRRKCTSRAVRLAEHLPRKAADVMHQLLTYTATWVVIGQLESINCRLNVQTPDGESTEANLDGQGEVNRVNNQHEFLLDFLEKNPIRNPEEWMSKLSKADQSLANRIMTARQGYANMDFEWKSVEALAKRGIENGNKKLQTEMLESMMTGGGSSDTTSSA